MRIWGVSGDGDRHHDALGLSAAPVPRARRTPPGTPDIGTPPIIVRPDAGGRAGAGGRRQPDPHGVPGAGTGP